MSGVGLKRDLILNVTIWLLYIFSAKICPLFGDISRILEIWAPLAPQDLGTTGSFGASCVPLEKNDQISAHLGPSACGFRIMKIDPVFSNILSLYHLRDLRIFLVAKLHTNHSVYINPVYYWINIHLYIYPKFQCSHYKLIPHRLRHYHCVSISPII